MKITTLLPPFIVSFSTKKQKLGKKLVFYFIFNSIYFKVSIFSNDFSQFQHKKNKNLEKKLAFYFYFQFHLFQSVTVFNRFHFQNFKCAQIHMRSKYSCLSVGSGSSLSRRALRRSSTLAPSSMFRAKNLLTMQRVVRTYEMSGAL